MQMPKATTGGATNAWEPQVCRQCGAQVAPGAPRCPECPSISFEPAEVAAGEADIAVTLDTEAADEGLAGLEAKLAEAEADPADEPEPDAGEAPAEPQAPDAVPGPAAAPPRTPPRRA